jgi:large subunit ribosomal protein L37Ae
VPGTYKVGPSGSFGARYGTVARKRYSTIVTELKAPHECPQCHIAAVKRLSVGIWLCGRCGFKFAGGAYAPTTKLGEIAERASRAGVASTLLAEMKAEKAKQAEAKAKTIRKRRRKAKSEKTSPQPTPETSTGTEDSPNE